MKNFRENQRDCLRKLSQLAAIIANKYLLIGLALNHEMLKSINTFEPDTILLEDPMMLTLQQWKQSHLFNLCMI